MTVRHDYYNLDSDHVSRIGFCLVIKLRSSPVGRFIYTFLPVRRRIIRQNVERMFSGISPRRSALLCKAFYGHMWRFLVELIQASFCPWVAKQRRLRVLHLERLEKALAEGKGALWLCCHLGNWEVSLPNFMRELPQYRERVSIVRKRLRPAFFDRLILGRFRKAGIDTLPPDGLALRKILKKLANNEIVIFVLDQHSSPPLGIATRFFGEPASISRGLARIAAHTGAPVIPAITYRDSGGEHVCEFGEVIEPLEAENSEESLRANTQAYNSALETYISEHPEQWFCLSHRLWKL